MAGENPWIGSRRIQFLGKTRNQYIWWIESREGENWGRSQATNFGSSMEIQWLIAIASRSTFLSPENARFRGEGGADGGTGKTKRRVHDSLWWKAPWPSDKQRSVTFRHLIGLVYLCWAQKKSFNFPQQGDRRLSYKALQGALMIYFYRYVAFLRYRCFLPLLALKQTCEQTNVPGTTCQTIR